MKILHVVASLGLRHGGVSVSVRELCLGLAGLGHEVEILTTTRGHDPAVDGAADAALAAAGVRVRYCEVHPSRWRGQRYAYSPTVPAALRDALPRADVAHLHGLWQHPSMVAAGLCRRYGIPYVVSPCGALDPPAFRAHRVFKWLYGFGVERRTLMGAAIWHFTTAMEQRRAFLFGVRRPAVVIPCPVPPSPALPPGAFRMRYPAVGSRHLVLFLGRLHRKKRLDLVVEAFLRLAGRRDDLHLLVVGPDDGAGVIARQRVVAAGRRDRATFLNFLTGPEKAAALQDSTLFVLPSEDENFGLTVAEAMAAGVPVLVSPQVGLAESVAAVGAGLVVEGGPSRWAAAIEHLVDDPAARRAMGMAGHRFTMAELQREPVARAMAAAYAWAIRPSRSSAG